jgi:hypothetical protein
VPIRPKQRKPVKPHRDVKSTQRCAEGCTLAILPRLEKVLEGKVLVLAQPAQVQEGKVKVQTREAPPPIRPNQRKPRESDAE